MILIIILTLLLQIEIGKKSKSSSASVVPTKKARACHSEHTKEEERIGQYVLLKCVKYKDYLPQIGKIIKLDESTVTIEWLNGTYSTNFVYWKQRGEPICETFPRRAVLRAITFTKSMRLQRNDIQIIKELYNNAEFV